MRNEYLDQRAVELSQRLAAALDSGDVPEALELMALLRPIYEAAQRDQIVKSEARCDEAAGPSGRAAQCGTVGVSPTELLMLELSEYRAGLID